MNYGLQLSASGVLTSLYRQDVLTNNLANVNTVGFKPDFVQTRQREVVRSEDNLSYMPSNDMLEQLGGGVLMMPNRTSFAQGPIQPTGNPLDIAIEGNGFFMVQDRSDTTGDGVRLTRDGRMTRDDRGNLIQVATGMPLLDDRGKTIRVPGGATVSINDAGEIEADGLILGRIGLGDVADRSMLKKRGSGLFEVDPQAQHTQGTGRIHQHSVEGSAVDPIKAMMAMQGASKSVSSNIGIMQYQDRMMEKAINVLGKIG